MTSTGTKKRQDEKDDDHGLTSSEQVDPPPAKRAKPGTATATASASDRTKLDIVNEYQGYSFQNTSVTVPLSIDVVQACSMSAETFFDQYIRQRKPCVLEGLPPVNQDGQPLIITREVLENVAGDKRIQVEKRCHLEETFGQNRSPARQIQLTVHDFLKRLLDPSTTSEPAEDDKNSELLYWSTQEPNMNNNNDDDNQDTIDPFFTVPCRQLLDHGKIPASLPLAGNLVLQSCNLWMGASSNGASSGLHHDYHDNFYLLLHGAKRFRLLSPDCAPHLHVHGIIERIHPNGRISYVGKETTADGVPLQQVALDDANPDQEEDEEEEVVLGKGFDYVSSDDDDEGEDGGFDQANQTDDFEEIMKEGGDNNDNDPLSSDDNQKLTDETGTNDPQDDARPDSFSKINPSQSDQAALLTEFPSYSNCRQVDVDLKAGQMLYLPAGWFHEVTSKSSPSTTSLGQCHMALNYWYHPPDALDNFENPYKSDFWKKQELLRHTKPVKSM